MLNLDKLRTDPKAESEGAWFTLDNGMRVKIARACDLTVSDKLREELGPEGIKAWRDGKVTTADFKRVRRTAIALTCLKDWEPVEYQGGEFKFSADNLETLIRDEQLHDIRDGVSAIAEAQLAYREDFLRAAEKN